MRLRKLVLDGFRSYTSRQVLLFPKRSGLYLVTGQNKLEPELGGNGAGKSTLWDGLCWVWFGKTARGLKAKRVASWSMGSLASGETWLTGGHHIHRTWSPNSLELDGEPVTQEELNDFLGFNYESFCNTILLGQFGQFFFDLTPERKLSLFSQVLDLDQWTERAKKATERAALSRDLLRNVELDARIQISKLDGFRKEREGYRARIVDARETSIKNRALWKEGLGTVQEKLVEWGEKKEKVDKKVRRIREKIEETERELAEANKQREESEKELAKRQAIASEKKKLLQQADASCPTCGQPWPTEVDPRDLELTWTKACNKRDEVWELRKQRKRICSKLGNQLRSLDDELREVAGTRQSAKLAPLLAKEKELQGKLESLPQTDWMEEALEEYDDQIEAALAQLTEASKLQEKEQRSASFNEFWMKGFKEMRLWLVERALNAFAIEVNSSLIDLGLRGWEVRFDVERVNQSGTVTKGFTVYIIPPANELGAQEPILWEEFSGGESQRLRIAGAVGFAELIRGARGVELPMEVWDEPTAHIGKEGIDDLLRFFSERSRKFDRSVWVVDNIALDSGLFEGETLIVKDHEGSKIGERVR